MPDFVERFEHQLVQASQRLDLDTKPRPRRRRFWRRPMLPLILLVGLAGGGAAAATLGGGLAALDRPAEPQDALADQKVSVATLAETMPVDQHASRVLERSRDVIVTLVPRTDGKICVHQSYPDGTAGGSCPTREELLTEGTGGGRPGQMVGVVPDGVTDVAFDLTDGARVTVPVHHNVYHAPSEATQAIFWLDGRRHTHTLVPLSAFTGPTLPR